jgi:hypothetical protein
MGGTKTTLIADLLRKPPSLKRDGIIARAKQGYYHDYETSLATPKMTLYAELREAGFRDLAVKARDGDYDDEWSRKKT